jgi:homoserine acetyltransferase
MAFGTSWSKTRNANALIIRYLASRNFDASVPFGGDMKVALARIQAKTLLLTSQTDRTIPIVFATAVDPIGGGRSRGPPR